MNERVRAAFLIALLCAGPQGLLAESKPLEMKWNELAPLIVGHRVALMLTDGAIVKGEAVSVREDVILMDVSSAVKGYSKGNGSVPRPSVALIDLERRRGAWGRTMGTVLGILAGMTLGIYVAAEKTNSTGAGTATFFGIAAGMGVAGYFVGRELDKRVTHIKIVP